MTSRRLGCPINSRRYAVSRQSMRLCAAMATVCAARTLNDGTCATTRCSRGNTTLAGDTHDRRYVHVSTALTLRLFVVLSLLHRPASVAPVPPPPRCVSDVASRTIQADVVLEGRVVTTTDRPAAAPAAVVLRVLTVFKGRRATSLRRRRRRLRRFVAVDLASLAHTFTVADYRVGCVASPTVGARLIVFLQRRRHADAAVLTYDVTSGGSRRRREVDLYRMSALPAAVDERTRRTARKYSKRRNSECD